MKKLILLSIIAAFSIAANIKDSDLDGVPDNLDLCPNTPLLDIVNMQGCSKTQLKSLKKKKNYIINISAGYEYDHYKYYQSTNLTFFSISLKNKKYNIKTSLYLSYLKDKNIINKYKSNDLIWSNYFYKYFNNDILKLGIKGYFTTHYNKKFDYAFLIEDTHYFNTFDIGGSYKYKIHKEKNTNSTQTISIYSDIFINKLTISPYSYISNSSYNKNKWYKYAGITLFYSFNKHIGISIDSSFDLKETSNYTLDSSLSYTF